MSHCTVLMASGATKKVSDVQIGDVVVTLDRNVARVTHVLETIVNNVIPIVHFDNGLSITRWHPVLIDGIWKFPADILDEHYRVLKLTYCDKIYSFALDNSHVMIINGIKCITLGHNIIDTVASHDYFGSNKVLEDLTQLQEHKNQKVTITRDFIRKDPLTGLICGIKNPKI